MTEEAQVPAELVIGRLREKVADLTLQIAALEGYIDLHINKNVQAAQSAPEVVEGE